MFDKAPELFIDKEGKWYADGVHMFRMDIVKLFSEHLVRKEDGSWIVEWDGKTYPVKVEDVPFVIDELIQEGEKIKIRLTDNRIWDFQPKKVIMKDDIVHVALFSENIDTLFSRKAQWQLNNYLQEEDGHIFIKTFNKKLNILTTNITK